MYYVGRVILWIVMHIAFNLHFEGRENIPKDRTVIFTSNHRSNCDPPLVGLGIKQRCSFMAKEELFKNKFFAAIIRSLGAFPVSRGKGDMTVIDTAVSRLENGEELIIFPEGTRSKDGKVHRGKTGASLIAAKSGADIVPVGVVFGEKLKFRCRITVKYGKPIHTADFCTVCDTPNPRELVKLKNVYMAEITELVEGHSDTEGDTDE
jgi:1-acyl-sn-glycerol-3-phosphate acyltransferase/cytidylate kinase